MANTKVRTRKISWKAEVDKLDPTRYRATNEYRFSNGRIFKRRTQDAGIYN